MANPNKINWPDVVWSNLPAGMDDGSGGLVKPAVAVVAVANLALTGEQTIDGQLTSTSLVLATVQTAGAENGPWVSAAGAWARPTWYPNGSTTEAPQFLTTFVRLGTVYVGSTWRMTTASVTIGTTATTWVQTNFGVIQTLRAGVGAAADGTIPLLVEKDGIGVTPADGLILKTVTPAANGAQQEGPAINFEGYAFDSTASASKKTNWRLHQTPVQVAGTPTSNYKFDFSVNGGAFATAFTLGSDGGLLFSGSSAIQILDRGSGLDFVDRPVTAFKPIRISQVTCTTFGVFPSGVRIAASATGLSATTTSVWNFNDTVTARTGWFQWAGQSRVSTQFDATTTTLGNVTGLTMTVAAGRTYKFRAVLDATLDATGGGKYAIGGTATATAISYRVQHLGASLAVLSSTRQTALASSVNSTAALTDDAVVIEGLITVNAGGTLTVQFAQQSATGTSSILVGSTFMAFDIQ